MKKERSVKSSGEFATFYMSFLNSKKISKSEMKDLCDIINKIIIECRKSKYTNYDIGAGMEVGEIEYTLDSKVNIEQWGFSLYKSRKENAKTKRW